MGAEQNAQRSLGALQTTGEVTKITRQQNELDLEKMGVPPALAKMIPGAKWLMEHGGIISGAIDPDSGDIIIDSHLPDMSTK